MAFRHMALREETITTEVGIGGHTLEKFASTSLILMNCGMIIEPNVRLQTKFYLLFTCYEARGAWF